MGQLTLSANSTIDFSTTGSNLLFNSFVMTSGTLSIYDYTGQANSDNGSANNDRLLFSTAPVLSSTQLAAIQFYSGAGTGFLGGAAEISYNGYSELVVSAVPEPTTILAGLFLLGFVGLRERRRMRSLWRRVAAKG